MQTRLQQKRSVRDKYRFESAHRGLSLDVSSVCKEETNLIHSSQTGSEVQRSEQKCLHAEITDAGECGFRCGRAEAE